MKIFCLDDIDWCYCFIFSYIIRFWTLWPCITYNVDFSLSTLYAYSGLNWFHCFLGNRKVSFCCTWLTESFYKISSRQFPLCLQDQFITNQMNLQMNKKGFNKCSETLFGKEIQILIFQFFFRMYGWMILFIYGRRNMFKN